jgi:leucyl-tRNA synthetase
VRGEAYLLLKWKKVAWSGFVTGGIEEGEDLVEAGKREILEETGYKNARFVRDVGQAIHVQFYHPLKEENRHARFHGLYFELENGEQDPIAEEEKDICDLEWVPRENVESMLNVPDMKYLWHAAFEAPKAYIGDGLLANSGKFSGMPNREVMWDIVEACGGEHVTQYRIRDWLISRQRYWGCPIPIVYDPEGQPHLIPPEHLPWHLPTDVDFKPTGKSPLASSKELHERVEKIFGEGWTPEYDTLDTFVDSSWYFLRYLDAHNTEEFSDPKRMKEWMPVDRYSGGSEHTTLHLLYARFFTKALYDLALSPVSEPFIERFNRGLILGPDGQKMSKSKGNVVNPDELVQKYGADAVRLYLAFIGPYNEPGSYPWNLTGVDSMRRFLDRIYKLSHKVEENFALDDEDTNAEFIHALAKASAKIGSDIERFKFNTAISALMILVRDLESFEAIPASAYRDLLIMLAPFAPHLAEHLWQMQREQVDSAGRKELEPASQDSVLHESIHLSEWPYQGMVIEEELALVIVQINSKKKGEIQLPKDASEEDALALALALPTIAELLAAQPETRIIYVRGRILNFVAAR